MLYSEESTKLPDNTLVAPPAMAQIITTVAANSSVLNV